MNENSHKSQAALILKALQAGEALTRLDQQRFKGCLELPQRIYDLKQKGYPIEKKMIELPSGAHLAQYTLPKPAEPLWLFRGV